MCEIIFKNDQKVYLGKYYIFDTNINYNNYLIILYNSIYTSNL